mgnify:FL=1
MATLLSDAEVAERVLAHIRDKTTDRSQQVWSEPVTNYRSPDRFAREMQLLRSLPVPYFPSAALDKPGAYVARVAAGTPLLVVRGEDGRVRAFRNACRHRGMPLADGVGCSRAFVCRYHGWTYQLDGRLRHIPDADGFGDFDKDGHPLVQVEAEERLGLVFVRQQATAAAADDADDPWAGLPELAPSRLRLMDVRHLDVDANWKIFLEGFLEGYHIRSTHRDSFYPYGFDNLNVIEHCGRNSRVTFPFRRIEKLADVPPNQRKIDGLVTYVYQLFPNTLFTVLSHHSALLVLEPVAMDRTRLTTYVLADVSDDPESLEAFRRDTKFVDEAGGAEDREVVAAIQSSIASEANECFTFGRFEGAISHFHQSLRDALAQLKP